MVQVGQPGFDAGLLGLHLHLTRAQPPPLEVLPRLTRQTRVASTRCQQRLHGRHATHVGRGVDGEPINSGDVGVGPRLQEEIDHGGIAVDRGQEDGREAIRIRRIHVSAGFDECCGGAGPAQVDGCADIGVVHDL